MQRNIFFVGPYNSGKSTLINALIGRDLLSDDSVLTELTHKIIYDKEEKVKVFRKNQINPEIYPINEFDENFVNLIDPDNLVYYDNYCTDIEYSIDLQNGIINQTTRFIELPGLLNELEESKIHAEHNEYKYAIVFLTHGTMAWSLEEREFISKYLASKHQNNVFFVVTHADQISEELLPDFDKHCKEVLHDMFIDKDGNFDKEKYQRRVFCLNGYGALCARTGTPYKINRMTMPIKEEDTGIIEFENALIHFLNESESTEISSLSIGGSKSMRAHMNNSQQLLDQAVVVLEDFQSMVGYKDPSAEARYGFVPGLEMPEEAKILGRKIDELKHGLFQVLFIGYPRGTGKYSFISALLGKNLISVLFNPKREQITKIVLGDHEGVKVFSKFEPEPEEFTVKDFERFFNNEINETKNEDIDYVVINLTSDIFDHNIQLVDFPGLQNTLTENMIAKEFAQRADAIVFLTDGMRFFSSDEKEYISRNFANRYLDNVFFVITHADQIPEDELPDFDKHCKEVLHDVFVDKDNHFDEAKYHHRCFFMDVYGALCARTGTPYKNNSITVPIKEEDTGILEFQNALYEFLGSEDMAKSALSGFIGQLEHIQKSAKGKVENILSVYEDELTKTEERDRHQRAIIELKKIIQNINDACLATAKNIVLNASDEYDRFVTRTETEWDSHFDQANIDFGFSPQIELVKINLSRDSNKEEKYQKLIKPITDAIENYVIAQSHLLSERFSAYTFKQIAYLQVLLEVYFSQIESLGIDLYDILVQICLDFGVDASVLGGMNINKRVVLVAILLTEDPVGVINGIAGNTTWSQFIKDAVYNIVNESVVAFIVSSIFGAGWVYPILRGITTSFEISKHGENIAITCISNSKSKTIDSLKSANEYFRRDIEDKFGKGLLERTTTTTDFIFQKVSENTNDLDSKLTTIENQDFNLESEIKRYSAINLKIQKLFDNYRTICRI